MQPRSHAQQEQASAAAVWSTTPYGIERRIHRRYPINLEIEYRSDQDQLQQHHSGRTSNISSGGVLFETRDSLPVDSLVELVIHWPCLLDENCFLKLVVRGRVVRSDGKGVAVRINQDLAKEYTRTREESEVSS